MISSCPYCWFALSFSEPQRKKLDQAIAELAPGKRLTIKCPQCQKAIKLGAEALTALSTAGTLSPPPPPDLDWLKSGKLKDAEKVADVPMALILHPDPSTLNRLEKAMESVGYRVLTAGSVEDAVDQIRCINFACIAFHADFEPGGLEQSSFHNYMRQMSMDRRRYIFYILIGPRFHSLYDLQALSNSANLVVADGDLAHFDIILRKAIPDYEELFGPILEELSAQGKR